MSRLEKMPVDAIEEMREMGARMKAILDNIQNIYAEIAERYGIKFDEHCEVKKAIYDALAEIEVKRRCCE